MSEISLALSKHFYDPKSGFISATKLYHKLKPQFPTLKQTQVNEWVKEQAVNQMTNRKRPPTVYSSIQAPSKGSIYQLDLMIYDRFEYHGYKYILVVVDIYSRFAMAKALTNRTLPNLMKNIKEIFAEMGKPHMIHCDNEFNKKTFNTYCQENEILTRYSLPDEVNKNAIVERLNGTIANILQKWRVATGRHDWYKVLDDVMDNYNNNIHSTIKAKPIDVWEGKDINHQKYHTVKYDIKVGDKVRIKRLRGVFDKGDSVSFSKNLYTVRKVDGIKVYLDDYEDFLKPYQLRIVKSVQEYSNPEEDQEKQHKAIQRARKLKRDLNKEGIEENQQALRRTARERKVNQLEHEKFGKIVY